MGPCFRRDDACAYGSARPLLQAQRHEAQFAVGIGNQKQHGFLAVLLQLLDALLDVGGIGDRLLRHLDNDVAGGKPLLGGVRGAVNTGDDHALDAVLDLVAAAQVLAQIGEVEAERLLGHELLGLRLRLDRGRLRLFAVLQPSERDPLALLLTLADDDDVDLLADRRIGDDARQILRLLDVVPIELDHDVARLDAGRLRRALVVDARDQRAARRLDVEAFGDLVGDLLNTHAEPAAPQFAELAKLIDHANHRLRRHGKADTDRAAGRRDDQRVDADHFAVEIEQGPARIAAVDGGIGLDVIVVRAGRDIAIARRDDTCRHRTAEAEGIADRDHPFAKAQFVGIAELHRGQRLRRLELENRNIGLLVDADQLGLDLGAVIENDVDLVGVGNDVIIGHDNPRRVDDEAGTERIGLVRLHVAAPRTTLAAPVLEKVVEELLKGRAGRQLRHGAPALAGTALGLHGLRGGNIDHRIDHFLGNVGDRFRPSRLRGKDRDQHGYSPNTGRGQQWAQAMTRSFDRNGHVSSLWSKSSGIWRAQCRLFEVSATRAANFYQELQIESGTEIIDSLAWRFRSQHHLCRGFDPRKRLIAAFGRKTNADRRNELVYLRTAQITISPTTAEPMPAARRTGSGVSSALLIARRIQPGIAANNKPSITNRIPKPMRKSANAMDLIGAKSPFSTFSRSLSSLAARPYQLRLISYGFGDAAGAADALPDAAPKNLKKSESGRSRKRVSLLLRPFSYAVMER